MSSEIRKTQLAHGQRLDLTGDCRAYRIIKGSCELYIINKNSRLSYFYRTVRAGEAVFPLQSRAICSELYCLEDVELEYLDENDENVEEWRSDMRHWFADWLEQDDVQIKFHRGEADFSVWSAPDFLMAEKLTDLWQEFEQQQKVVIKWLENQFRVRAQKRYSRIWKMEEHQQRLLQDSFSNLLQKDNIEQSDIISQLDQDQENQQLEQYIFLVRAVAHNLGVPTDRIFIEPNLAKRLDQVNLLKRLINKGNMNIRLVSLGNDWYLKDCGTLLGYYGTNKELVALLPSSSKSYKMISLEHPVGITVDANIASQLDKDGFQCYGGFPARKLNTKDVMQFMLKHCWKHDYVTILLCSFVAGIIPLASPIITQTIFSDIIPINDYQSLSAVTQIMLLTGFTMAALSIVRSIAVLRITNHVDMSVEAAMWGRLLQLPVKFFRQFETGELLSRMNGIEVVKSFFTGEFVGQVFNFIFSFWSLLLMLYYSTGLTIRALLLWFIYFIIIAFIYRRIIGFQREMVKASNEADSLIQQIFSGLDKFRVHGAENQAFTLWSKVFGKKWKWIMKLKWQGNYNEIIGVIQPFILSMLLYYTVMKDMDIALSAGGGRPVTYADFLAFQAAFSVFNSTVVGIVPLVAQLFTIRPYIDNLKPILEAEPEVTEDKVEADILTGMLKVENLTFRYAPELPDVLHDVSFEIKPGENVAIVGKSGCGKSTLLRLLMGMETPNRGAVYYDHQDLQELSLSSVRSQLGVVLQSGQLMTGTIYENIIGTSPLSIDDAWEAAEKCGIAKDIREMPMGMHTIISEGSGNISGGQKQRILIARAIVAKPAIIMLDEATSALDNQTQAIVTDSLNNMNSTRIVVAHRLSTIREADRILVIEAGRLMEQGSFDELLAQDGIFAKLAKRQMV